MAITAPTNFNSNRGGQDEFEFPEVSPGETLELSWNPATGDFTGYYIACSYMSGGNMMREDYRFTKETRYTVTVPSDANGSITYGLRAYKNSSGGGFDELSDEVRLYLIAVLVRTPSSITVGDVTHGQSVTVSWSAVSGTPTYTLQRSINGGTFTDVYTGSGLSYSDTVGDTWTSVQYRVKAAADGNSSSWTLSAVKTVQEPPKPVISGHLVQLENEEAEKVYPKTTTDGVFRHGDGKTLESILEELKNASSGGVTLEQVNEAIQKAVLASWGKSYG